MQLTQHTDYGLRLADRANCTLRLDCSTSSVLARAMAAFLAVLDETTLEEAVRIHAPAFAPWARVPLGTA